jgi:hypothetical protein
VGDEIKYALRSIPQRMTSNKKTGGNLYFMTQAARIPSA